MSSHAALGPRLGKVLVITGCWTALLALTYVSTYLLIGDLIAFGKLSGSYAFWPDFAGNFIVGVLGGLVGGSLLVFKVNPGYRHETFLSGIVHSVVLFLTVYVSFTVFIVFAMPFVLHLIRGGTGSALVSGWNNVVANVYTPSFLVSTAIFHRDRRVDRPQALLRAAEGAVPGRDEADRRQPRRHLPVRG